MARFLSLFAPAPSYQKRNKVRIQVQVINNSNWRVLLSNEEYSSRYAESHFVEKHNVSFSEMKPGTLLYIWQKDNLLADVLIPHERPHMTVVVEDSNAYLLNE